MSFGSYLRLRGGTYHFRVRIPDPLRKAVGKSEMTVSLRTGRFDSAIRAARTIRTGLDSIMEAADQGASYAEIERRVRAWMSRSALDYEARIALNDGLSGAFSADEARTMGPEVTAEMDGLFRFVGMTGRDAAKSAAVRAAAGLISDPKLDGLVQALARDMGFDVAAGSPAAKLVRRAILRNFPNLLDHRDAADLGLPLPDRVLDAVQPRQALGPSSSEPQKALESRLPIRELWDAFCDSKIDGGEWKNAEKVAARSTLKLWLQSEGEQPISAYRTTNVEHFRRVLRGLPDDYYHNKQWRSVFDSQGTLALFELAKLADCARMSPKTFNKHLSRLNEFWKWAAGKGDALPSGSPSIFTGSFIKVQKNRIGRRLRLELRRKFEEDEIATLLASPTFLGARSARDWKTRGTLVVPDHRYWITLIGLLHGMRREEPVVLKVRHVKQKDGIWYFDLLDEEIVPLLKDVGSPRHIPIHKALLELGFIEARVEGRRPESALFPEAVSHSEIARHGDPFGKWFLLFRRFHGVDDPKLDFHSVRHTVISRLLDAGVPENHVEEICGHEGAGRRSEIAAYDHGRLLGILKLAIDRLIIPIDTSGLVLARTNSERVHGMYKIPDQVGASASSGIRHQKSAAEKPASKM
ncbi:site-specific integrase [Lichenibacterium minor]|uniref:site-specific integrase n=1 Tax=Lichenibacterium minor TaxID=2316528 RepID=UPI0013EB1B2F|nr:site-specific integrase [Lichenibacterium minor]